MRGRKRLRKKKAKRIARREQIEREFHEIVGQYITGYQYQPCAAGVLAWIRPYGQGQIRYPRWNIAATRMVPV